MGRRKKKEKKKREKERTKTKTKTTTLRCALGNNTINRAPSGHDDLAGRILHLLHASRSSIRSVRRRLSSPWARKSPFTYVFPPLSIFSRLLLSFFKRIRTATQSAFDPSYGSSCARTAGVRISIDDESRERERLPGTAFFSNR